MTLKFSSNVDNFRLLPWDRASIFVAPHRRINSFENRASPLSRCLFVRRWMIAIAVFQLVSGRPRSSSRKVQWKREKTFLSENRSVGIPIFLPRLECGAFNLSIQLDKIWIHLIDIINHDNYNIWTCLLILRWCW